MMFENSLSVLLGKKGVSMQSIIDRGFWSSPNTFILKYLLSVAESTPPSVAGQEALA